MKWIGAGLAIALLSPQAVTAQEEGPTAPPDRFALNLGSFFLYDSDTDFSARSGTGAIGTSINFERDLSGDDGTTVPRIFGYYRFNPHHRIDFGWYKVERDGSRSIDRELVFGDATFPVSAGVESTITTELTKLAYTWSFYHVDKVELGASVGANVTSYEFSLDTDNQVINQRRSTSAPLPVFGLRMDYTINPRWHLLFTMESFYIEVGDKYRGSLDDFQLGVEYQPFQHVLFGASANRLAVDAEIDDGDYRGSISDLYRGAQIYVGLRY